MKKILIACRGYYPDIAGGGEISTKYLTEELSLLGYDVEVLAVNEVDKKDKVNDITVNRLRYANLYWSMRNKGISKLKKIAWHFIDSNNIFFIKKLNEVIDQVNPEILITSTIEDLSSIIWKVAKKKGIRTIHILRSYSLLCTNANMFKEDNCGSQCHFCKGMTYLKKLNSGYVDDIVGISKFVLNEHIKNGYFSNARRHVIYNICLEDVLNERKYNGFESRLIKVGYLGRVHKTKGIELIFEAIEKIQRGIIGDVSIRIAGSGEGNYISDLTNEARKKNLTVEFLGNVPANEFLDSIDLLVVPSKWNEPFGRVIVESMARKVPVAAKIVGGIPELLSDNEGFLFGNEEELASVIEDYMNETLRFNFILDSFETKNIIGKWKVLLES
ncbi:glycosyltransferase [Pantoea cypripedii]|uniref:glycosyltransferase n=1 Tax=Pantoea cypripedii TaxID=55209 RepID=UPI002FC748A6